MKGKRKRLCVFLMSVILLLGSVSFRLPAARAMSDEEIEMVVYNLLNAPSISAAKRPHAAVLARNMLSAGYELTFTAGLIANYIREGNIGYFESMNYSSTTTLTYVRHLKGLQYDGGHWEKYGKWAGKTIYGNDANGVPIDLYEVDALVEQLINEGHTTAIFGLGSLQWTYFTRIRGLMDYYKQYASGRHITEEECIAAEMAYLQYELTGPYHYVYKNWRAATENDLYTVNGAYNAGYYICRYYEIPADKEGTSSFRGELATKVYADMVQGTEQGEDMIPDEESPLVNRVTVESRDAEGFRLLCEASDNVGVVLIRVTTWNEEDGIDEVTAFDVATGGAVSVVVSVPVSAAEVSNTVYHSRVTAYDAAGNASPVVSAPDVLLMADTYGVLQLPASLTELGENAFEGIGAEVVILPERLRSLPAGSFSDCREMRYLVMPPDSLVMIDPHAFDDTYYAVVYQ